MTARDARYVEVRLRRIRLERAGRRVLRDIDWIIRPAQRWVLAGANGAGKTQLLKLVAGAVWPTPTGRESRTYRWREEIWPTPYEVQDEIGYLGAERQDKYERYGWNHAVRQIVGTGLYRTDIPLDPLRVVDRRRIAVLLGRLGIAHLADRGLLSLSYGERRLVLLARVLASRPRLLLLDELLNGLDDANRGHALHWLRGTTRSQLPWVLATHRADDVPAGATHALILDAGRVVYCGALAKAPLARWLDRGRAAGAGAARIARTARTRSSEAQSTEPLVQLRHASVYVEERPVLENLSFAVRAGESWVVHGPNGGGKTTLLRTLYGDYGVAAGGRIERAGMEPGVPLEQFKRRAGLIAPHLQADHPQHLSVAEVVQSGRHASIGLNEAPSVEDRAAAHRALEFFGLTRLARRTLRELSYGQMRRVLFARAWIARPQLLLLDEPLAGVDTPTRGALLARIATLVARGTAVVMATHHREEWPAYATHELELVAGRARYCGRMRTAEGVVTQGKPAGCGAEDQNH